MIFSSGYEWNLVNESQFIDALPMRSAFIVHFHICVDQWSYYHDHIYKFKYKWLYHKNVSKNTRPTFLVQVAAKSTLQVPCLTSFQLAFNFHTWMAGLGGVRERGDAGGGGYIGSVMKTKTKDWYSVFLSWLSEIPQRIFNQIWNNHTECII